MRYIAFAAAALLALCDVAAVAQPATDPAQVEIEFAPPLDTALRFRVVRTKHRSDRPASAKISWVEELRFARSGDGFVLHWRMDPAALPPEMRHPSLAPMVAPFIAEPIAFDLDAQGSVLRVRDWDAVLPRVLKAVDGSLSMAVAASGDKPPAEGAIASVRAMFADLDAEEASGVLLKNVMPLLQWGGMSLRLGEPVSETHEQPIAMLGGEVLQNVRVTLTALDPGKTARIEVHTETDGASLKRLIASMAQRFGAISDPAQKERMTRELAQMEQMQMTDTSVAAIDLATGLPTALDHARRATIEGVIQSEDLRIEWLR